MAAVVSSRLPVGFYLPFPGDPTLSQESWQYYLPDAWNDHMPQSSQSCHSPQGHQKQRNEPNRHSQHNFYEVREEGLAGDGYDYAPLEFARIGQDLVRLIDKLQTQLAVDRRRLHSEQRQLAVDMQRLNAIHRANEVGRMVASPKRQQGERHGSTPPDHKLRTASSQEFDDSAGSWAALGEWQQQLPSLHDRGSVSPARRLQDFNGMLYTSYRDEKDAEDQVLVPRNMGEWHQQFPYFLERGSVSPGRRARRRPGRHATKNILFSAGQEKQGQTPADVAGSEQTADKTQRGMHPDPEGPDEAGGLYPVAKNSISSNDGATVNKKPLSTTTGIAIGRSQSFNASSAMHEKSDRCSWADANDDEPELVNSCPKGVVELVKLFEPLSPDKEE